MQPSTSCSLGILEEDSVVELGIPTMSNNSSTSTSDVQFGLDIRLELPSSSCFKGWSTHVVSQRKNEVLNVQCTPWERFASIFYHNTRVGTSSSTWSAWLFGLARYSSRPNNTYTNTSSISKILLLEDNVGTPSCMIWSTT